LFPSKGSLRPLYEPVSPDSLLLKVCLEKSLLMGSGTQDTALWAGGRVHSHPLDSFPSAWPLSTSLPGWVLASFPGVRLDMPRPVGSLPGLAPDSAGVAEHCCPVAGALALP
jgi:hypothetical protein